MNDQTDGITVDSAEAGYAAGFEAICGIFAQLPSLLGRQLVHDLPAFTQVQLLHKPVLLHLQHTTIT